MKRRYFLFSSKGGRPIVYAAIQGRLEEKLNKFLSARIVEGGYVKKVKKLVATELFRKNREEMKAAEEKGERMTLKTAPILCDSDKFFES